jgi:hypothetical protein
MERTWHLTQELVGLVGIKQAAVVLVEAIEGSVASSDAVGRESEAESMAQSCSVEATGKTPLEGGKRDGQEEEG